MTQEINTKPDFMYENVGFRAITLLLPIIIVLTLYFTGSYKNLPKISFFDFILISMASFRLTRLLTIDQVTEFLRGPFVIEKSYRTRFGVFKVDQIPRGEGLRKHIGQIISCYWCLGMWVSGFLVVLYYLFWSLVYPIVLVLAIAGFQAILESMIRHYMASYRYLVRE